MTKKFGDSKSHKTLNNIWIMEKKWKENRSQMIEAIRIGKEIAKNKRIIKPIITMEITK